MLLKLFTLAVAAIPVLLFLRSVLFRRSTRTSQAFAQFKRQVDVAVWLLIGMIGVVGATAFGHIAWTWWTAP
jgi:hypothetical protein